MNKPQPDRGLTLDISAVERETGLSKDVLRMWERRYGFPKPARDENGERQYTVPEIAKLRAIKRLMDVGMRPGKIVGCTPDELDALAQQRIERRQEVLASGVGGDIMAILQGHDALGLYHALAGLVMRQGLQRFVVETMTLLNRDIGDSWMRGDLQIFEEHLYSEQVQVVLPVEIAPPELQRAHAGQGCCSQRRGRGRRSGSTASFRRRNGCGLHFVTA